QFECERQSLRMTAPAAHWRCDGTDLRANQSKPASMECFAKRHRWCGIPKPARLDNARLEGGARQCQSKPGLTGRRMHDQVLLMRCPLRRTEAAAEVLRQRLARCIDVHHGDPRAGDASQQ